MNKRERVLCALKKEIPDAVPYMYSLMDKEIQEEIIKREICLDTVTPLNSWGHLGRPGEETIIEPVLTIAPDAAEFLKLDAVGIQILPPIFAESEVSDGRAGITNGLLNSFDMLNTAKMPDPDDEKLYKKLSDMIKRYKEDYAFYARVRLGISPTLMSMGIESFSYSLFDEPDLVEGVIKMYCEWGSRVFKNLSELDFDFFWCFDDLAHTKAMMFSRDVFTKFFIPNIKKARASISKPVVFHSDGNILPILDDLIEMKFDAIHPLEPGAMDLDYLKSEYGRKLCLIGNLDIDKILTKGTLEEVDKEVKNRIDQLGPGGGFIISDSNSVPSYCNAENVIAMSKAVEKYRYIY